MDAKRLILAFFEAENNRDWVTYRQYLAPDVVWVLHTQQTRTIVGVEDYMTVIQAAYRNGGAFVCEAFYAGAEGRRAVTILRNELGERSCDIFDLEENRIVREYEFLLG